MAIQMTNTSKAMFIKGQIRMTTVEGAKDTFKMMLMRSGFTFNRSVHVDYESVKDEEVYAGDGGYESGGKVVELNRVEISDSNNTANAIFNSINWIVSGRTLVTGSVIMYDDTTSTELGKDYNKAVILWSSTSGTLSVEPGGSIVIPTIEIPFGEPVSTI